MLASSRLRPSSQQGFGIIESVMAAAIFLIFAGAAFAMVNDSQKRTADAERHAAGIALAQREVERLRQFGYAALGMTASPASAAASAGPNPNNPNEYVSGGNLLIKANFRDRGSGPAPGVAAGGEPFVSPLTGGIDPAPVRMTSNGYLFDVHRYVTWVDLTCTVGSTDQCSDARDAKRITIAVRPVTDQVARAGNKPLWVTTVLTDPTSVADDATPPTEPADPTGTVQAFYLYDTRCDSNVRVPVTASHAVSSTGEGNTIGCSASNLARPDLMGPARAPGIESPGIFNYSTDYPFERAQGTLTPGLALLPPTGSSCPTSYTAGTAALDKHRVHRWVTAPMTAAFVATDLTPRSSLAFYTQTVDNLPGAAELCASLYRVSTSGTLTLLADDRHRMSAWPDETYSQEAQFTLTHNNASGFTIGVNERLMLTLSLTNDSLAGGIELLYDDPVYDTVLQVGTTTPITTS
jgi:type II secretory pathway pseudopilin PulG